MDPRPLQPPELRDGEVVLRPLREADAAPYAAAFADDPGLARALGLEEEPDEDAVRARLPAIEEAAREGRRVSLAVTEEDRFLGEVLLHSFAWKDSRAEVAFWLVPAARGRGLARRAVALLIGWAFDALGMERIEMTTLPDNAATLRLAERLGFTREGTMRSRNFELGRRVDVVMLGLLRGEWRF